MSRRRRVLVSSVALTLVASASVAVAGGAAAGGGRAGGLAVGAPTELDIPDDVNVGAPALSHTGRYIAGVATKREGTGPVRTAVLRYDQQTGNLELLNESLDGGLAGGRYSMPPVISGSGDRVAFSSNSADLVAGDTNNRSDAFVRDVSSDQTLLSSRAFGGGISAGATGMTSLSKNGRYAVFTSNGTDLVPGSTTTNPDVYLRDLATMTTRQVTLQPNGQPSRGPGSTSADVSADGNLVAFVSYNRDLVRVDGADGENDLFIRNMSTGVIRWLSPGLPDGADPTGVVLSPDGRWVSTRWADGSLHLTNVAAATTTTVVPEGFALTGSFSRDGRLYVYNAVGQAMVRNLATGVDTPLGTPPGGTAGAVSISGNGEHAAFEWVPDDGGPVRVFLVDLSGI